MKTPAVAGGELVTVLKLRWSRSDLQATDLLAPQGHGSHSLVAGVKMDFVDFVWLRYLDTGGGQVPQGSHCLTPLRVISYEDRHLAWHFVVEGDDILPPAPRAFDAGVVQLLDRLPWDLPRMTSRNRLEIASAGNSFHRLQEGVGRQQQQHSDENLVQS